MSTEDLRYSAYWISVEITSSNNMSSVGAEQGVSIKNLPRPHTDLTLQDLQYIATSAEKSDQGEIHSPDPKEERYKKAIKTINTFFPNTSLGCKKGFFYYYLLYFEDLSIREIARSNNIQPVDVRRILGKADSVKNFDGKWKKFEDELKKTDPDCAKVGEELDVKNTKAQKLEMMEMLDAKVLKLLQEESEITFSKAAKKLGIGYHRFLNAVTRLRKEGKIPKPEYINSNSV